MPPVTRGAAIPNSLTHCKMSPTLRQAAIPARLLNSFTMPTARKRIRTPTLQPNNRSSWTCIHTSCYFYHTHITLQQLLFLNLHTHQLLLFLSHPHYIAAVAPLEPARTPVAIFITPTLHCSSRSSWTCTHTSCYFYHTHITLQQSLLLNLHAHQLLFWSHPHYIAADAPLEPARTPVAILITPTLHCSSRSSWTCTHTSCYFYHTHITLQQLLFLNLHAHQLLFFITPTLHCSSCSSWTCTQTTRLFFVTLIPKVPGSSNLLACWWIFNSVSFFLTLFLKKKKVEKKLSFFQNTGIYTVEFH